MVIVLTITTISTSFKVTSLSEDSKELLRMIQKDKERDRELKKERKELIKKHENFMQDLRNKGILK